MTFLLTFPLINCYKLSCYPNSFTVRSCKGFYFDVNLILASDALNQPLSLFHEKLLLINRFLCLHGCSDHIATEELICCPTVSLLHQRWLEYYRGFCLLLSNYKVNYAKSFIKQGLFFSITLTLYLYLSLNSSLLIF